MEGSPSTITATLLPGAGKLLEAHARELPQRDDLCGAFCGALALHAAGLERDGDGPLDQDTIALAAGSLVSAEADPGILPAGESGRRDYRLELPRIADGARSGTTAAGVVRGIEVVSGGSVCAIPLAGPWTVATLAGAYELALEQRGPTALLANHATHHLWGSHPSAEQLLAHLLRGAAEGPAPDWDVGHFACIVGRVEGPAGVLYVVADTYPALGSRGLHLQPAAQLAAAIAREDKPAGGVIAVVAAESADAFRAGARDLGLHEELWDNGTPEAQV
ncbi:MAG TPA: hypothetical protein VHT27_01350 [Solirubrobacteraceae bacterium]|jgi:hypothetical protein|nr:hypothetical protein [Solirubrobacteraceae bacterium]